MGEGGGILRRYGRDDDSSGWLPGYEIEVDFFDFADGVDELPGILDFRVFAVGVLVSLFFSAVLVLQVFSLGDVALRLIVGGADGSTLRLMRTGGLSLGRYLWMAHDMGVFFLFVASFVSSLLVWYGSLLPGLFFAGNAQNRKTSHVLVALLTALGHPLFFFSLSLWMGAPGAFLSYFPEELYRVGLIPWCGTFFVAYSAVIGLSPSEEKPIKLLEGSSLMDRRPKLVLSFTVLVHVVTMALLSAALLLPNRYTFMSLAPNSAELMILRAHLDTTAGPFFTALFKAFYYPAFALAFVVSVVAAVRTYLASTLIQRIVSFVLSLTSFSAFLGGVYGSGEVAKTVSTVALPSPHPLQGTFFNAIFCYALFLMIVSWAIFFLLRFYVYPNSGLPDVVSRMRLYFSLSVLLGLVFFPELLGLFSGLKELYWVQCVAQTGWLYELSFLPAVFSVCSMISFLVVGFLIEAFWPRDDKIINSWQ